MGGMRHSVRLSKTDLGGLLEYWRCHINHLRGRKGKIDWYRSRKGPVWSGGEEAQRREGAAIRSRFHRGHAVQA
jgi:hypothetical protein